MSGIVGIVNLDGAPVEPRLLERLTDFLAFRGPDAQTKWIDGQVGLGHTALWTTFESERERQPSSLDGQVWITADARIDARAELIQQLAQRCGTGSLPQYIGVPPVREVQQGGRDLTSATDVDLILYAYHAWGEDCVERLLGDFAFAIWDGRERRLFCARDHMGVKPFYYAQVGNFVIFSNTLDCLRQHPAVSDRLNDSAIGHFLLFGSNQDSATTTFADIQRLPPAHRATWSDGELQIRRYWTLPIDDPLIYPRPEDYTERFNQLLRVAVNDRIRTDRIGIFMSGGLDSSGMAATACSILRERPGSFSIQAFTAVYDHAIPDQERYYAGLVAKHLGIPIHFYPRDEEILTPWGDQTPLETPEPVYNPFGYAEGSEYHRQVALHSRVFLFGEGPDNALSCDWRAHLHHLVKKRRWERLLPDYYFHAWAHRRVPYLGRVRNWWRGYRKVQFPAWLNQDFAARLRLRERWKNLNSKPRSPHPTRPNGYRAMSNPVWQDFFESFDNTNSRASSETRHPYLDLRLLRYLLAIPPIPWCCKKHLLRRSMRDALPKKVLHRPKSPLVQDPDYERACRFKMPQAPVSEALLWYVNFLELPRNVGKNIEDFRVNMNAVGLAFWLRNQRLRSPSATVQETRHGAVAEQGCRIKSGRG